MLRVAAFDLGKGKDKYCTGYGPVPSRLPVISMSTRFHDKTVETADIPVYNVPFFFHFFFVNVFLCVFKAVSTQLNLFVCNILGSVSCQPAGRRLFGLLPAGW